MDKRGKVKLSLFLFILLALVFTLYFVSPAHVIRTSSGGTTFSVNEDTSSLFNISVNNTDAGDNANITQVNITLPSGFVFSAGSNATSSGANTFVNTSSVLSWSNSTGYVVNGSTVQYFWFNETIATPGNYNVTVTTTNGTGSFSSNLSVQVNDTTNPSISFGATGNLETNTFYTRSNITFNVTSSDNVAINTINVTLYNANNALVNSSINSASPFSGTFTGLGDGVYYLNSTVNDTTGNTNSTSTLKIILASNTFQFNGTVYDINGNTLNSSVINITLKNTQNMFSTIHYLSTTTNATGWFNLTLYNDSNSAWMYQPVITWTNSTTGAVEQIGQSLPAFPKNMIQEIAGISFYLKDAGTINITAINSSNARVNFKYQIKDQKLGYPIAENFDSSASEAVVNVPRGRNYSIMIYPDQSMPVSFNWNNFSATASYSLSNISSYNFTTKTLHYQFNTTMTFPRVYGYINVSGVNGWNEFTVVPYLLEPGNMVHSDFGDMPYNISGAVGQGTDIFNLSTGFYNMTLPSTPAETSNILLFATARNGSNYYGGFRNISSLTGNLELNFTNMAGLFGTAANITMDDIGGGAGQQINISTAKHTFNIVNSSNITLSQANIHAEITVDYSNLGAIEFTWMADVGQEGSAQLKVPILNNTGVKEANIFAGGGNYAPKKLVDYPASSLASDNAAENKTNITVSSFNPKDIEGSLSSSSIFMAITYSNSTCNIPLSASYSDSCFVGGLGGDKGTLNNFNPMKAVMGGGALNFIMGKVDSNGDLDFGVVYVNVDLLASGPPDALFDGSATETTSGDFEAAMRFGSGGPTIYDYVLISMPYTEGNSSQTGLDENSDANLSIKNFYNDNWGIIWNITANGTNGTFLGGNYSHYETYSSEWQTLIGNNTCHTNSSGINSTNPCYIDKIGNMIWVRLPHFSGTQPGVTGAVVTASSSSSSSGGGGSGGVTVGGATTTISESQLNEGYTKQLAVRDKIKFNISNASHILELTGATATTATIKVTSEPQIATLNVEENKKFELNGDNKYDLDVRFNSVFLFGNGTYRANITMKFDSSEVTTQDSGVTGGATSGTESGGEGETGMNEERGGSLWWLWISLIIIALAAVTGYIIWKKERR